MKYAREQAVAALALTGLLVIGLASAPLEAQISSQQVRDRYKKTTQGGTKLEDFIKKLESENPDTRLEGVKALGETKDPKAVAYLIQAVGDPDQQVKCKAIDALGAMRAEDATQVLVQQLVVKTTEPQLQQRVVAALGQISDPRAVRPLIEFLQRDHDGSLRGTTIFALGEIGAPESLDTLMQMSQAESDPTMRRLAGEAAAKVKQRQAVLDRQAKQPAETFLEPKQPPPQQ